MQFKCSVNEAIQTTRELIKFDGDADIALISQRMDEHVKKCKEIEPEKLQKLMHSKALLKQQEEWLLWHERLNNLPCAKMRKLAEKRILTHYFTKLHTLPLFPSCAFGDQKRRAWRIKDAYGSIRKIDTAAPGSLTCVDQNISSHPSLAPQLSGFLTESITWS